MVSKKILENTTAQPDGVLAKQVNFAWEALSDIAKVEEIGRHLRAESIGERMIAHFFQCLKFECRGRTWAATLAKVLHAHLGAVCEIDLLSIEDALLTPA